MNEYLIWSLVVLNIYFLFSLKKEKKRLRILTSFVSGLFDLASHQIKGAENGRRVVFDYVLASFEGDFWSKPYEKFVKSDRNLFWEEKLSNGGFNQVFLDFHDKCLKEWYAIQYNKDEGQENDEVLGEKLIYQDFLNNKKENLKNIRIPKNPRLFFKYLSEEEINKIESKFNN